ncbi:MAG: bluf domain protein [Bacteroidetes bacterium HGW-Bacteroidetes-4]|jgi:hypothetical protein|nr:MAG: bluf domain protein [Bacteroidetes bacterium HGW-Bacteroidetes-4]
MLSQLVYISVRSAECTDQEIEKILESSIRNNGKIDITGVLLYSDQKFLQVLEGKYKQIIELYDKIKEDKRHKNVVMLSLGSIKERNFPSWQMGSKKISLNDVDFNTRMTDEDKLEFKSILSGKKEQSQKVIDVIKKFF